MFGDVPDPSVTTARVGSGTVSDSEAGVDALSKEGLAGPKRKVESGLV